MKKFIVSLLFTIIFVSQSVQCMDHLAMQDEREMYRYRALSPELYEETKKQVGSKFEIYGYACYACAMCCACCKMVVVPAVVNTAVIIESKRME